MLILKFFKSISTLASPIVVREKFTGAAVEEKANKRLNRIINLFILIVYTMLWDKDFQLYPYHNLNVYCELSFSDNFIAKLGEAYFKNVIGLMILSKCFEDLEKKYDDTSESFKKIV